MAEAQHWDLKCLSACLALTWVPWVPWVPGMEPRPGLQAHIASTLSTESFSQLLDRFGTHHFGKHLLNDPQHAGHEAANKNKNVNNNIQEPGFEVSGNV